MLVLFHLPLINDMNDADNIYSSFFMTSGSGKNKDYQCYGCNGRWKCGVGKLRAHILKIKNRDIKECVKKYTAAEMQPMVDLEGELACSTTARKRQRVEAEQDRLLNPASSVQPVANAVQQPAPSQALAAPQRPLRQLLLPNIAITQRHDRANLQISMLFYGFGIPFNVSRSPLFRCAMQSVAEAGPDFKPVGYNALRGHMLIKV
jgi:hypothetical protein